MRGEWYTTDTGRGGRGVAAALAVILLFSSTAAAIASAIVTVIIIGTVVVFLAAAALIALVAYRIRAERRQASPVLLRQLPPVADQLPASTRPALEAPAVRQLHLHFHGTDAEQVAEILRRHGED